MKGTLFIIVFLFILFNKSSAQYEVMVSTDYPPYNYLDERGELVGFNVDILNAIKKLYKAEIKVTGSYWNTANIYLEEGKIQAIAGAHYPGSPDNNYIYTRSVIQTSHCFLYNQKYLNKISADEIRTLTSPLIVLWNNDVLIHYIKSINPNARFIFVDNYADLLNNLDKKEVTCGFSQKIASMYFADKLNKPYIKTGSENILDRNMGFKISKKAPQLAKIFNNGLEVIISNGEYQKIYDKWIEKYNRDGNREHLIKYFILAGIIVLSIIFILLSFNQILQIRVRNRTRDLQHQLELNTQITKELEKQKMKAEESDKMKSAFLTNMSHEIRTPMNGILGFTELLKSHNYSIEERDRFVKLIQQSGERMLTTINNIIKISKIESGVETLQIGETNIAKIIDELSQFFAEEAKRKGIHLIVEKKEIDTDCTFYSDKYKINSILTNLIKNALKFTHEGSVKISYKIDDNMACIYVSDTGIGIEKDKQETIFNYFIQADISCSSRFEGSGLGLSISMEYTKMLNGEIRVESETNKGSTFIVEIPNQIDKANPNHKKAEDKVSVKPAIPAGLKVIVAEDDKISFVLLKYILDGISANILHAKNGIEAVILAKNNPDTDIILMDSKMPQLNGIEAVKQIREFNKEVFIVSQTAYAIEDYKDKTIEAGCNEFIEKPVNKNRLLEIISKGISKN